MTSAAPLEGLIEAMASAVVEAQGRIEQAQVAHLGDYFDEDNRPKSVVIRMPSMKAGAEAGDEDLYRAPLLPLVPTASLRIKDVEISFDADLGSLVDRQDAEAPAGDLGESRWRFLPRKPKRSVGLDTASRRSADRAGAVRVVLRVEGVEPSEGTARLVNHLAMTQGVFQTFRPDD
ncbi:DUF2589 domain-containing protein [Bacillus sp. NP157]|nr:DUF2589 domain-containing protein [Bacillus sp. NP157]